jgi:hypothetical protein
MSAAVEMFSTETLDLARQVKLKSEPEEAPNCLDSAVNTP